MAAITSEPAAAGGVVELREDVPLKSSASGGGAAGGGVRALGCCFAGLTVTVTVALLAQIYAGDYQVVPHGAVAAGACSGAGAGVLRAGGAALDAAAAAALCLAVAAPRRLSLNASGALLYWEYRTQHKQLPLVAEWGDAGAAFSVGGGGAGAEGGGGGEGGSEGGGVPQLVAALAALHSSLGRLPWRDVLQPALALATHGSPATETQLATLPDATLAATLADLQRNTSAEVWSAWSGRVRLVQGSAEGIEAGGGWTLYSGGSSAKAVPAIRLAGLPDSVAAAVVGGGEAAEARGAGLAVADTRGTYVALVAGEPADGPAASALDLAPAILIDGPVCGSRWVVGAESWRALAAAAAAARAGAPPAAAVERPRPAQPRAAAAVSLVLQRADSLASHADSRAGGLAERF